jgi:YbbR domain-containing protein
MNKKFIERLKENVEIKIIAVVFAILIWFYIGTN